MLQDLLNYIKVKSIILDIFNCSRALIIQRLRIYNFFAIIFD